MKDFKVFVGLTEENLVEVLHGSLKNDTTPEAFPIRYVNNAHVCFPTRYVKIIPLSYVNLVLEIFPPILCDWYSAYRAHGLNFHTSIWYVSMTGIAEKNYVGQIYRTHEEVCQHQCRVVTFMEQILLAS